MINLDFDVFLFQIIWADSVSRISSIINQSLQSAMAASQERIARACAAMKSLYGTPPTAVRNAVDQLLKVYNNNWEFIEDNNYNVVFEYSLENIKDEKLKVYIYPFTINFIIS